MVNVLVIAGLAGVISLGAPPQPAQAETPLKATFRCANDGTCSDAVQGDGVLEHGATFDGFRTWSVKKTVYLDGAFVNTAGGIDINLIPEAIAGDRALQFRLSAGAPLDSVPAVCVPPSGVITATDVDFRFNVTNGSVQGISVLASGESVTGAANANGRSLIGIVNFALGANASGALFFNHTQDATSPFDDQTTLTRLSATTYRLTSSSTVLLQCTVTNRGKTTTYNVGTYNVPFELTVVAP